MTLDATAAAAMVLEAVERGVAAASLVLVSPPEQAGSRMVVLEDHDGRGAVHGTLGSEGWDRGGAREARRALADGRHRDGVVALDGGGEAYLEVRRPVPDLVIVGAGHIALPMARLGAGLGFRVWVLDDRPDFATRERFPEAHSVIRADFADPFREVPLHGGTHVLLVTRGHRYDYDCLVKVLAHDPAPAYIGMIGSRRRVRATYLQLVDEGVAPDRLRNVHAPVGLDIGAETPEEIAVAVAAELIKVRRGGSGASLREMEGVAHRFFPDDPKGGGTA
jgi:xanthine dehydrogenase accessory factor